MVFEMGAAAAATGIVEKMAFVGTGGAKGAEMAVSNAAVLCLLLAMLAMPACVALREGTDQGGDDRMKSDL